MTNPKVETDIGEIFIEIKQELKGINERLNKIEVGQAKIEGKIEALDTKVDQLEKRISNVEFASRGILIGIGVVILGGLAMVFGLGKA